MTGEQKELALLIAEFMRASQVPRSMGALVGCSDEWDALYQRLYRGIGYASVFELRVGVNKAIADEIMRVLEVRGQL